VDTDGPPAIEGRIYWGSQQIAFRSWSSPTYFDHQDWEGTERMRTDPWGALAATYTNLPFGDGSTQTVGGTGVNQDNNSFTSLELDPETETYHAQFRQYGPAQGSWMSPDPYSGSYDMNNPQSLNRYSYVLNNPLAFTDRLGLDEGSDPDPCGEDPGSNCPVNAGDPNPPTFTVNTWYFDPCDIDWIYCSGPAGPGSPTTVAPTLPSVPKNRPISSAQIRCENGLLAASILHGLGEALLPSAPGSNPEGDLASAARAAAQNPVFRATAGVITARLGRSLLADAGAVTLGAAVSEFAVPAIGMAATGYIVYSAVTDAASYFNNNVARCAP
jgi:RHS repeat-associated protein